VRKCFVLMVLMLSGCANQSGIGLIPSDSNQLESARIHADRGSGIISKVRCRKRLMSLLSQ